MKQHFKLYADGEVYVRVEDAKNRWVRVANDWETVKRFAMITMRERTIREREAGGNDDDRRDSRQD